MGLRTVLAVLVPLLALAGGCGGGDAGRSTVDVFAASSLTAAFTDIGTAFTAANPDSDVVFNFAASSELATQVREGAPADVIATADTDTMQALADADQLSSEPSIFATNRAAIIVANGNPLGIDSLDDLAGGGVVVVQCAPEVPCGRYAQQVFANAGVVITPKSFEENVKSVVSKVTVGEADAGIVYATDVLAAGDAAEGVDIPDDVNVIARYPIATVGDSSAAADFMAFVLGPTGRRILAAYGFGEP